MNKVILVIVIAVGVMVVLSALALVVLIPIIGSVTEIMGPDPSDKTVELLNDVYSTPDEIKLTKESTFTPGYVLSTAGIAQYSPLAKENICLSKGDFGSEPNFELETEPYHKLTWKGESNKNVKILITCNLNLEQLKKDMESTQYNGLAGNCGICENRGRCCLVALQAS